MTHSFSPPFNSPPLAGGMPEWAGGAHQRYQQQANWTRELRNYIFSEIGLNGTQRILEVGCGTGAILATMDFPAYGLDIHLASLNEAKCYAPTACLSCADGHFHPYADASFDVIFSHFLFLWLRKPQAALAEMRRVTRTGGYIVAFAEPDYTRRVDEPAALAPLGAWQREALQAQGADISMGAKVAEIFFRGGIEIIETGTISKSAREPFDVREWELEWATLEADLAGRVADERIQKMKKLDREAWEQGQRVLHVPTHYVWGRAARG